ncbi:MAG: hypothetical protein JWO31_2955 [Phycisphaerales bacterium]|nr:hypothetical protein [Phycisphaerales bacterium]
MTALAPTTPSPATTGRPAAVAPNPYGGHVPPQATDVLAALRPAVAATTRPPGAFMGVLLALVSLGVVPAVLWAFRFQSVAAADRRALRRVADWTAGRVGSDRAAGLLAAADQVRPHVVLPALVALYAVAAVVVVALSAGHLPFAIDSWGSVLETTYGLQWFRYLRASPLPGAHVVGFMAWSIGAAGAYLAHLLQVHVHARAVRRFLDEFNRLVPLEEGFGPVLLDPIGFGFAPVWMLAAAVLCAASGWWGVAFAAAGATDRRYRRSAVRCLRGGLAKRVKDVVLAHPERGRHAAGTASGRTDVTAVARCPTPGCGRPFGAGVKFCPRCGKRVARSVDRKA